MADRAPFNISLLDVDSYIKEHNTKEVTSTFVRESSSNNFHPGGLFSEQIFGQIATDARSLTSAYISLNCKVFHPIIFQNIISIKRFYGEIMSGNSYAIWDQNEQDFIRAADTEEGADTGFAFFLKHFDDINFKSTGSLRRSDKVETIEKFKKLRLVDKMTVLPAGIRDVRDTGSGRMEKDSINSLYVSLLANAKAMPPGADKNPLFDTVHYIIQKKVVEIYEQLSTMVRGKGGFFEGKFYHRNISRGTRNVITASQMDAEDPDSPQYHKTDETKVPLFQAAKAAANSLVFWFKSLFYDQILNNSSDNIPLINKDNLKLEYVPIDAKDKDRMLTSDGIEKTIDRFRDPFNRFLPAAARVSRAGSKPVYYYLFMVYDTGDEIFIFRNTDEFKARMKEAGKEFDPSKLRALTNAEMLYIVTYSALKGTHGFVTRYPVTDEQSIYPSKTHVMTTQPSRKVKVRINLMDDNDPGIDLPEYPILNRDFVDALMLHPTRLKSLTADFDGNCVIGSTIIDIRFTDEWVEECTAKIKKQSLSPFIRAVSSAYRVKDGWYYAEVKIESLPKVGTPQKDKHGALVYTFPKGLEVLSIKDGKKCYLPVEKFTVEDNCEVTSIRAGARYCTISTNASVAVFDHVSGGIKKVTPKEAIEKKLHIPVLTSPVVPGLELEPSKHKLTYREGVLEAGRLRSIHFKDVEHCVYRRGTVEYLLGLIVSLLDSQHCFNNVDTKSTLLLTYTQKQAKGAAIESDLLIWLLYYAGINYYVNKSGNKVTSISIDLGSLLSKGKITVLDERTNHVLEYMRNNNRPQCKIVPVTKKERKLICDRIKKRKGPMQDLLKATGVSVDCFTSEFLKKYVDENENTPLSQRIYSDEIRWFRADSGPELYKTTVYDLIVPESKVFAVNDGMIVFDTCSWTPVFSKEANEEIAKYLNQPGNYILPSGSPIASMFDDLCQMAFLAMTQDTPELTQK